MGIRGIVVIAGTLVSFLFAVFAGGSLAWHLFGFLVVLLAIVVYGQIGPLSRVVITRRVAPGPYYAGGWMDVSLTVSATRWPWLHIVVVDRLQAAQGDEEHSFVVTTVGRRVQTINYQVRDLQRGSLEFTDITLVTSDVFGLFQRSLRVDEDAVSLRVWPSVLLLSQAEFSSYFWHGEQLNSRQTREQLTQLQGIREYVAGDRLSHVHWRTSAHTGDFKVKHFEPENKAEFIVLLDGSKHFTAVDWELAVSIAASLAHKACRSQLMFRVVALDQSFHGAPPSAGPGALARMMDFLSTLAHGEQVLMESMEPTRYGRHMLVISTAERRATWQGIAESIVIVGPGGVTSLTQWRASLGSPGTRSRVFR